MLEACEHLRFMLEGRNSLGQFVGAEAILAHLFDGYKAIVEVLVLSFIDSREATPANLCQDTVSLFKEVVLKK